MRYAPCAMRTAPHGFTGGDRRLHGPRLTGGDRRLQTTHDPRPTTHEDPDKGESVTAVWAEAMRDLACSPGKRRCMGRAARDYIEREFSLDAMVRRYADLYRRVME